MEEFLTPGQIYLLNEERNRKLRETRLAAQNKTASNLKEQPKLEPKQPARTSKKPCTPPTTKKQTMPSLSDSTSKQLLTSIINDIQHDQGWSVNDFAKHAGVNRQSAYNLLNGKSIPSFFTLCNIANSANISLDLINSQLSQAAPSIQDTV